MPSKQAYEQVDKYYEEHPHGAMPEELERELLRLFPDIPLDEK